LVKKQVLFSELTVYKEKTKIIGYHGTASGNVESIINNNFKEPEIHDIWLGRGVYFFVDGIGIETPLEYAKHYAKDSCWNNSEKKYNSEKISVIEAVVKVNDDKFLDLTIDNGSKLFNEYRSRTITGIEASGKKIVGQYNDADIFKFMREDLGIEFVKSNVYIKFAVQRIGFMESRIPNVTIFVVNNPLKNIQKQSIKEVYKGDVK